MLVVKCLLLRAFVLWGCFLSESQLIYSADRAVTGITLLISLPARKRPQKCQVIHHKTWITIHVTPCTGRLAVMTSDLVDVGCLSCLLRTSGFTGVPLLNTLFSFETFCLSHFKLANWISSLLIEPAGNSLRLFIGAQGDTWHASLPCGETLKLNCVQN